MPELLAALDAFLQSIAAAAAGRRYRQHAGVDNKRLRRGYHTPIRGC
jgi:uncharacterized protein YfiM (DUF2279 family)